jgi:hypothetical protein
MTLTAIMQVVIVVTIFLILGNVFVFILSVRKPVFSAKRWRHIHFNRIKLWVEGEGRGMQRRCVGSGNVLKHRMAARVSNSQHGMLS